MAEREAIPSMIAFLRQKVEMPVWWVLLASIALIIEGLRGLL